MLKTQMSDGEGRGFWRKFFLCPLPVSEKPEGHSNEMKPKLVGKRAVETDRRMTGTGRGDVQNKNM